MTDETPTVRQVNAWQTGESERPSDQSLFELIATGAGSPPADRSTLGMRPAEAKGALSRGLTLRPQETLATRGAGRAPPATTAVAYWQGAHSQAANLLASLEALNRVTRHPRRRSRLYGWLEWQRMLYRTRGEALNVQLAREGLAGAAITAEAARVSNQLGIRNALDSIGGRTGDEQTKALVLKGLEGMLTGLGLGLALAPLAKALVASAATGAGAGAGAAAGASAGAASTAGSAAGAAGSATAATAGAVGSSSSAAAGAAGSAAGAAAAAAGAAVGGAIAGAIVALAAIIGCVVAVVVQAQFQDKVLAQLRDRVRRTLEACTPLERWIVLSHLQVAYEANEQDPDLAKLAGELRDGAWRAEYLHGAGYTRWEPLGSPPMVMAFHASVLEPARSGLPAPLREDDPRRETVRRYLAAFVALNVPFDEARGLPWLNASEITGASFDDGSSVGRFLEIGNRSRGEIVAAAHAIGAHTPADAPIPSEWVIDHLRRIRR